MAKPFAWGSRGSTPKRYSPDVYTRRDILHSFRCPRECRDFEDGYASIIGCPFGHYDIAHKQALPSYVCVPYLLDECSKKMTSDELLFCEDGFHLADRDLLDMDHYTKRMADCILQRGPLESEPGFELTGTTVLECCICFAPYNGIYGQLSDCTHVFCTKCITDWFKKERNCPVCRKASRFILAWHGLIASKEQKAKIARMQAEMVKVSDLDGSAAHSVCSAGETDHGWSDWARQDFESTQSTPYGPFIYNHSNLWDVWAGNPALVSTDTRSQGSVGVNIEHNYPPNPYQTVPLEPVRTITSVPREQIQVQVSNNCPNGSGNNYSRGGNNYRGGNNASRGGSANGRVNAYRGNNRGGYRGGGGGGNRGHFQYNFY